MWAENNKQLRRQFILVIIFDFLYKKKQLTPQGVCLMLSRISKLARLMSVKETAFGDSTFSGCRLSISESLRSKLISSMLSNTAALNSFMSTGVIVPESSI